MAGRGRGGGGRGRGRASMSFHVEQLGFTVGEALPGPVLQPPPVYPLMENRPVPLQSGPEMEYLLALKRDFVEYLHDSPAYLLPVAVKTDIERYSDRYQVALNNSGSKSNDNTKFDPTRLPPELRPTSKSKKVAKRKADAVKVKVAKAPRKVEDINNRLEELEKNEEQQEDAEGEEGEAKEDEEEKEEAEDAEEVEEEDADEEMDDGTDYVNNYFDNGESYLDDEDDNLDDGPVY